MTGARLENLLVVVFAITLGVIPLLQRQPEASVSSLQTFTDDSI